MMKKILIIDDDYDYVEAVSVLLHSKGYNIITAENGKKGIEKVKKEKPDLIILDVMMTKKTEGFEVARQLRKEKFSKKIPIIMMTRRK